MGSKLSVSVAEEVSRKTRDARQELRIEFFNFISNVMHIRRKEVLTSTLTFVRKDLH